MNEAMYDLHSLGWHSFQQLCLAVAREVLGQTVESFLDSNDGGRDGAFTGTWTQHGCKTLSGRFVIQCKFTTKKESNLYASDLSDEAEKARRLVAAGLCDCYLLLTNAGLSGAEVEKIEGLYKSVGVKEVLLYGSTWICQQIQESKRLRMLVPRVYGLGDLSQILDDRAYAQARALLASLREDLSKIVVTGAYKRAAAALDEHGFVLLIGEPAAGKTTIASLLAMAALDQWNASTLKLDDPAKVIDHWNPDEPSQFFWVDDAFGVSQYESDLVHGWNHRLAQIKAMLKKGAKIVITSRDYIYNRARKDLKEGAFPLLRESQVVIDVHDLTPDEKRQILYNHLKLGRQPQEFRTEIKPLLEDVAAHPRFIPETARRLGDPVFTGGLFIASYFVGQFVEKQEQLLQEVLQGLDSDSQAALALIYMRNDALESPIQPQDTEIRALERLGSSLGGCITALESLNGSLVQHVHAAGVSTWRFKHPTISDAFGALLVRNPELLEIYIQGSSTEDLIDQVTCGDVGLEKAVIIPRPLFPLVLRRLGEFSASAKYKSPLYSRWGAKSRIQGFLARRCSKEFLSFYVEEHPGILEAVSQPGLFLSAVSEVDLAARLHEYGLLPEAQRRKFVETVSAYALSGEDLYAVSDYDIRSVFTEQEFESFRLRVRTELVPRLDEILREWQSNYSSDESADDHMEPLRDSFRALSKEFSDDEEVKDLVERETERVNDWVAEHTDDEPDDKPKRTLGDVDSSETFHETRSIFEDVDV
jgi:energy-coupling factor transporter ATP-binding protein EcfA2